MTYCVKVSVGGTTAIVRCSGRRPPPPPKCQFCALPAVKLCDAPRPGGKTCDNPICDRHAFALDAEHDLCPPDEARWFGREVKL